MRVTSHGNAARDVDRVVSAELGSVNIGVRDKRGPIALVAEAPDHACFRGLELLTANFGLGLGELSDGVKTIDGEAGEAVRDDTLGGRSPRRRRRGGLYAQ